MPLSETVFHSMGFGLFIVLAAAALGSFLGARAARWAAEVNGSPQAPSVRSACQTCGRVVPSWRMVPLVSWLLQRGRCGCPRRARLSRTYVVCEAGAVIGALSALAGWGAGPEAAWLALAGAFAAWAAATDLDFGQIPDAASAGLVATGLGAAIFAPTSPYRGPEEAYLGALVAGGALYAAGAITAFWKKREALGLGDVKLAFGIGAMIGPYLLGPFLGAAAAFGLTQALIGVMRGEDASKPRPFAPAMALGAAAVLAAERYGVLTG